MLSCDMSVKTIACVDHFRFRCNSIRDSTWFPRQRGAATSQLARHIYNCVFVVCVCHMCVCVLLCTLRDVSHAASCGLSPFLALATQRAKNFANRQHAAGGRQAGMGRGARGGGSGRQRRAALTTLSKLQQNVVVYLRKFCVDFGRLPEITKAKSDSSATRRRHFFC